MMGTKQRDFSSLQDVSLEELVPEDNFYRRLERTLDLSFVRDLVKDRATPLRDALASILTFSSSYNSFFSLRICARSAN